MMVGVLFSYTARDEAAIADTKATPDVVVGVVGKQWSWDFNYLTQGGKPLDAYDTGVQTQLDGSPAPELTEPTLWLPVNKRVEFQLSARDVIHSFWIPAFLYKMDAIPGIQNKFQVIPQKTGTYRGKCAELCGEFHSEMLFNVKVVTQAEFDAHIAALRSQGQTGALDSNLGREKTPVGGYTPGRQATAKGTVSN
jgi:cytochrome c oxidase subunit 2